MSAVSLLEDLIRFRDDAIHLGRLLNRPLAKLTPSETWSVVEESELRIAQYQKLLPSIIAQIDKLLEFATDPAINPAKEVSRICDERDAAIVEMERKLANLASARDDAARSYKAELARQRENYEGKISEINRRHGEEIRTVHIANQIELEAFKKGTPGRDIISAQTVDDRSEEPEVFAELVGSYPPLRR